MSKEAQTPAFDESLLKVTNSSVEEINAGKWTAFPEVEGVELKIARYNNNAYLSALTGYIKENVPYEEAIRRAMSEHILTDWRGFSVELFEKDGSSEVVEVEYSSKRAFHVLTNDLILRDFVVNFCQGDSNFIGQGKNRIKKK